MCPHDGVSSWKRRVYHLAVPAPEVKAYESSPIPRVLNLAEAARFVRCSRSHLSNVLNGKVRDVPPFRPSA
jgi:hypothetical protein